MRVRDGRAWFLAGKRSTMTGEHPRAMEGQKYLAPLPGSVSPPGPIPKIPGAAWQPPGVPGEVLEESEDGQERAADQAGPPSPPSPSTSAAGPPSPSARPPSPSASAPPRPPSPSASAPPISLQDSSYQERKEDLEKVPPSPPFSFLFFQRPTGCCACRFSGCCC